jgi:two-component system NtrC family sensor kinase
MLGSQLGLAVENFGFYSEAKDASAQFWDLYENARDILFTVDPAGRLISVNHAFEQFFGYSKLELIGKNILGFLTHDSAQNAIRMLAEINLPNVLELEVIKRDASHAFVEVSGRRLYKGTAPAGLHLSARDITEQKTLRALLVKAERCAAIGQVGIAVRHEINNPLTSVIGNVELLLERFAGKDKESEARLETILNNALRISEIIRRVEDIQEEKIVDYLKGIKMTDLQKE